MRIKPFSEKWYEVIKLEDGYHVRLVTSWLLGTFIVIGYSAVRHPENAKYFTYIEPCCPTSNKHVAIGLMNTLAKQFNPDQPELIASSKEQKADDLKLHELTDKMIEAHREGDEEREELLIKEIKGEL